tara:strand:+ start:6170 stop:6388 length:219 start_codon:yes stop_codon:yes gene_type:complete
MNKKYEVYISEEQGGYIVVNADNEDQAVNIAEDLVGHYGCDKLLFPENEELFKYCGKQKHGETSVNGAREIK